MFMEGFCLIYLLENYINAAVGGGWVVEETYLATDSLPDVQLALNKYAAT